MSKKKDKAYTAIELTVMRWTSHMNKRKIRRIVLTLIVLVLFAVTLERLYNSRDEFQTVASEPSYYGIIDAKYTTREKLRDFEHFCSILEENYPFFKVNERLYGVNWLENLSRYKRIVKNTENDTEYLVALNNILGDLNDKNTYILTGDLYRRFLMHYMRERSEVLFYERSVARYDFDWNFNNIKLDPNNNFIFHNGPVLETKTLIEDEVAYMKIKAMSYYHIEEDYPKIKSFLEQVADYDKLIIDIRGNTGGFDEYWINIVELLIDEVHSAEYYSFFRQNSKTSRDIFAVEGIMTIRELDEEILEQIPQEISTDFSFYKHNLLEVAPKDNINFKGKIYVLVDGEVFSSAEKFAAFAKDTSFATLVGETTGGGMTFEEIPMNSLFLSGFIINYSRELVLNSDGTINMEVKTIPHIKVDDPTPNDDFTKDKCIQAVIKDEI